MTDKAYKSHLRYKHMVARLDKLPFYRLESEVLAELAKGRRWRIEAALDALEKNPDCHTYVKRTSLFETAGRYGRLTAMHRLTDIYKSEKIDRVAEKYTACSPGVLEAFDMAALNGHYRVARYLRQFGAGPDMMLGSNRRPRAMSFAILHGDIKKIDFLLEAGADATCYLTHAIYSGNVAVAAHLLDAGADVNEKADNHWTPLHLAARRGDTAMVDLLIARGATAEACAKDVIYDLVGCADVTMLDRMIAFGLVPVQRDLEHAVHQGKLDCAQRILDAGVGMSPAMLVDVVAGSAPNPAAVALCLNNGIKPADALVWLDNTPDSYRYSSPGTREAIAARLRALTAAPPAAPKPPGPV